jgi:hypothetical protein
MKKLLVVILCVCALGLGAQTKTNGSREVNIYLRDGKTIIGKVVVNTPAAELFLLKSVQKKDTSNHYITTFYLGNKQTAPLSDIRILLKFNKPVIGVAPAFSTAFNSVNGLADDHMSYSFKAGRLDRDPGSAVVISFAIESKDKILTQIDGLGGILQ